MKRLFGLRLRPRSDPYVMEFAAIITWRVTGLFATSELSLTSTIRNRRERNTSRRSEIKSTTLCTVNKWLSVLFFRLRRIILSVCVYSWTLLYTVGVGLSRILTRHPEFRRILGDNSSCIRESGARDRSCKTVHDYLCTTRVITSPSCVLLRNVRFRRASSCISSSQPH